MIDGKRVRKSLKTRDVRRAARCLAELEEASLSRPRKTIVDAIKAFHDQHVALAAETNRKYERVIGYFREYCEQESLRYVNQVSVENMDVYARWRNKTNWTWIKEIEILRQFFAFCIDREWTSKNPAKGLKRPRMLEANDVKPYTSEEVVRIIAACDQIGRRSYERLRARAMVLLMRYAGLRISDVVTLSRDHIVGTHLTKRALKNRRLVRVDLHPDVLAALDALPHPVAAPQDSKLFFGGGKATTRTLVKAAARSLAAVFQRAKVEGAARSLAAVFQRAKVEGAHPHRFRHTLASDLLGNGATIQDVADILGDSPATILRHYAKWTPERQARQDEAIRKIHGTNLAQAGEQASKC